MADQVLEKGLEGGDFSVEGSGTESVCLPISQPASDHGSRKRSRVPYPIGGSEIIEALLQIGGIRQDRMRGKTLLKL